MPPVNSQHQEGGIEQQQKKQGITKAQSQQGEKQSKHSSRWSFMLRMVSAFGCFIQAFVFVLAFLELSGSLVCK